MALPNPYVGPQPLSRANQIYGRGKEIAGLADLLTVKRVVLFHSPSGAGKSSILHAHGGVRDQLEEQFDVWATTRVNTEPTLPVTNRFVWSSLMGFEEEVPQDRRRDAATLAGMTLSEGVASRARKRNAKQFSVLIFDQFEEVLRIDPSRVEEKREFFRQLGELLANRDFWAMFVLREDYLAALEPYARLVPTHMQNRYRVDLLSVEAARDAIDKPALTGGREYTVEALDKLVDDLARVKVQQPDGTYADERGPFIEPMQLQVACFNLWENMDADDRRVDPEDIAKHGDVTEALASYYAGRVAQIANGDVSVERTVRRWIGTELITPDGVRSQVLKGPKESQGLSNALIEELEKAHLVRPEQRGSSVRFELAHDRLVQPVTTNNANWFDDHLSPMQKRAELWNKQGQPESMLVTGDDMEQLREWTPTEKFERDFVRLSEARDRMLRRDRLKTRMSLALAAIAAIAFGVAFTLFLLSERQKRDLQTTSDKLKEQKQDADILAANLEEQRKVLAKSLNDTTDARKAAEEAAATAQKALGMADLLEARRRNIQNEKEIATAYISRALRRDSEPRHAMWALQQQITYYPHVQTGEAMTTRAPLRHASIAQDESRLVTIDAQGEVVVWNPKSTRKICQLANTHPSAYLSAVQPRANRFLLFSSDGPASFWSTESCAKLAPEFAVSEPVIAVGFQPDTVLTLSKSSTVRRIRLSYTPSIETVGVVDLRDKDPKYAQFSSDGRQVAATVARVAGSRTLLRTFNTQDAAVTKEVPWASSPWFADGTLTDFVSPGNHLQSKFQNRPAPDLSLDEIDGQQLLLTGQGRLYVTDALNGVRAYDWLGADHWRLPPFRSNDAVPFARGTEFLSVDTRDQPLWYTDGGVSSKPVSREFASGEWTLGAANRDGSRLLALTKDKSRIFVVNSRTGKAISKPIPVDADGIELSISENGNRSAAAIFKKAASTVQSVAWDMASGELIFQSRPFDFEDGAIKPVISDDGGLIVSRDGADALAVYRLKKNVLSGVPIGLKITLPNSRRFAAAFNRAGTRLAVTAADDVVKIFDLSKGSAFGVQISSKDVRFTSLCFSPDGKSLAVGRNDGWYEVFDAETGDSMGLRYKPSNDSSNGEVTAIRFTNDGRGLLAMSNNIPRYQPLWDLNKAKQLSSFLVDVAELYTGSLLTDDGVLRKLTTEERRARLDRVHEPGYSGPLRINEIIERLSK